jgi:hypothetical protein
MQVGNQIEEQRNSRNDEGQPEQEFGSLAGSAAQPQQARARNGKEDAREEFADLRVVAHSTSS